MKRLVYLALALAITGCDLLSKDPVKEDNTNGNEGGGSEITTPLFPAGNDEVDGVAQPKGALKSIETYYFNESSTTVIWDKKQTTIIYDELGRPKREDILYYNYQDGVAQGTTRTGGSNLFFYSPGKVELKYRYSDGEVITIGKIELNSDGLAEISDTGSEKNGKWVSSSKWQFTYNAGRWALKKKLIGSANDRDVEYSWDDDGSLYSAKEQWNGPANPDEDGSEYYNYGIDNPTYKQAYDISEIVLNLGGYYFAGLGSSKLPTSVRTTYRNEGKVFTYQKASSGQIVKISEKIWPFADDDPQAKNFLYHEYKLSYYD